MRTPKAQGFASRSAVLQRAVRLLRASELGAAYEDAWSEWTDDGDAEAWERNCRRWCELMRRG